MSAEAAAPPRINDSRGISFRTVLALLGVFAGALSVLYFFDPAENSFYPVCYFRLMTGLNCPGCGTMRAIHQLLHGHVAAAAKLNLLFVICVPLLAWRFGRLAAARLRHEQMAPIPAAWLWGFLVISSVFTVLRNLPGFDWLAP
jgi:hypothetical protein